MVTTETIYTLIADHSSDQMCNDSQWLLESPTVKRPASKLEIAPIDCEPLTGG